MSFLLISKSPCYPSIQEIGEGKNLYNIRQETPVRRREKGSQTSFEKFLHSLPKVDAVDRTVDWVLAQPNIEVITMCTHFDKRLHNTVAILWRKHRSLIAQMCI